MGTRSKRILIALAVVGGLVAAAYAAAPALLAAIIVRALSGFVGIQKLEIESVGLNRIDVAIVRAGNGQLRFEAQQAIVRFDPWPFEIQAIDIDRAHVAISDLSSGSEQATSALILPSFPLSIEELSVRVSMPWGPLFIPVSVRTGRGAAGGLEAEVKSHEFSARLGNPGKHRYKLDVHDSDNAELLSLGARFHGGSPFDFNGSVDLPKITQWIRASEALPTAWKTALAAFDLDSDGIRFTGTLERDKDFSAQILGNVIVHDNRRKSERLFELMEFRSGTGYELVRSGTSWSGSGDAAFRVGLDPETTMTGRSPAWRWVDDNFAVSAADPSLIQLGLKADKVEISTPGLSTVNATGDLRFQGVRMAGWPQTLPYYEVDGNWSWRDNSFQAEGTGTGPALPDLIWKLKTGGDRGSVEITSRHALAPLAPSLKQYTQVLARESNIKTGELDGQYRFEWTADHRQTSLAVTVEPVDADLDEMQVRGLTVQISNEGDSLDELRLAISAPTLKLAAGAVAQDFKMKLRLSPPELRIDAARTRLLHGTISIRPISINLADEKFELFADIDNLSLEKLMALFELDTMELTGEVSGPVRLVYKRNQGVEINKGQLHSVHPGVLRLSVNRESKTAAQFDNIALRALENFQYDDLKATLLYKPGGEYRITARIVGENPKVLDGHPIALNPTIQGRLPALFRAFFVSGDFSRSIIETLQKERALSTPGETSTLENN